MGEISGSEKIVSHVGAIIKSRYGREIEVIRLMNLGLGESKFITEEMGNEVHIPLSHGELFLGKAVLRGESPWGPGEVDRASETVKLALEPVLYREYLHLQTINQEAQLEYKELDIRPAFLKVLSSNGEFQSEQTNQNNREDSTEHQLSHSLLFIEGKNADYVRRIAQDIHEQSESWSFVQLRDLRPSIHSLKELETLALATIFVDAEEAQQPDVQEWIREEARKDSKRLLILVHVGEKAFSELSHIPLIDSESLPAHRLLRIEALQMLLRKG